MKEMPFYLQHQACSRLNGQKLFVHGKALLGTLTMRLIELIIRGDALKFVFLSF